MKNMIAETGCSVVYQDERQIVYALREFIEKMREANCPLFDLQLPEPAWKALLEGWCMGWSAEWRNDPPKSVFIDGCLVSERGA